LPLSITLGLRGGDNDSDDGGDDDEQDFVSTGGDADADAGTTTSGGGSSGNETLDNQAQALTCVVCFEQPRDALLMPCGHMYTCMSCTREWGKQSEQGRACPVCRAPVKKVRILFGFFFFVIMAGWVFVLMESNFSVNNTVRSFDRWYVLITIRLLQMLQGPTPQVSSAVASTTKLPIVLDRLSLVRGRVGWMAFY
jgi:hypothetical protein